MDDPYDLFSSYYRELIISTGHLKKEQEVVKKLLLEINVKNDACILDAACGTGNLLQFLMTEGYKNVWGLDSSQGMINRAEEISTNNKLTCTKWENMNLLKHFWNKFDLIFILSISLPHAEESNLPLIFDNILKCLKPGGMLIFDNREWIYDKRNRLIEPNRPIGKFRFLQAIQKHGKSYLIYDMCRYTNRQYIKYRIMDSVSSRKIDIGVSYLIKLSSEYLPILLDVGFSDALYQSIDGWPYQIILAKN